MERLVSTKRFLAERGPIHKKPQPDQVAQQNANLLNQGISEQELAVTAPLDMVKPELIPPYIKPILIKSPQ